MHRSARLAAGGVSLAAAGAALWLAAHHPLSPSLALPLSLAWTIAAGLWPRLWLFVLPAALPVLNLSPWTGWIMVEEFDLLVLGVLGGGYARLACGRATDALAISRGTWALMSALLALVLWGMARGLADAGPVSGWFDDYTGALNSLRVSKSALFAVLLAPLCWRAMRKPGAGERFAAGMLSGAVLVALAALWERAAYPGLLNFSDVYRTTALFWEMHVGGAAIDAYLALATPFAAWALWRSRTRWHWLLAALLAVVWVYVCLTTFARGAYLGVLTGLLVLGFFRLLGGAGWRRWAAFALGMVLVAEVVAVLGWGSFMASRLSESPRDYQSRAEHWARGVRLLDGPGAWLAGIGAGRLPARYEAAVAQVEFPGAVRIDETQPAVELRGPASMEALGGLYSLTQRVPLRDAYRLDLQLRTEVPTGLLARVCTLHLLYDQSCQGAHLGLDSTRGEWQRMSLHLAGPPLDAGPWFAPRRAALTLSVFNAGGMVQLDRLVLQGPGGESLLRNGDFSAGLAHWLPAAQYYFIPWHIDNLYLELLIERGLLGAGVFLALLAAIGVRTLRQPERDGIEPFALASLAGVLSVGLVSSVLDVPRVALLMWLAMALVLRPRQPASACEHP